VSRLVTRSAIVATALALALAASACSGNGGSRPAGPASPGSTVSPRNTSSTVAVPPVVAAIQGLCLARSQADADPKSVRTTFYDRSHEPLHTLARTLETIDRALAARLLEAKEAVEADVNAQPLPAALAGDLDHLIDVTGQVLQRLAIPAIPCT